MANIATDDKRDGASSSALITTISNPQHTMDDREGTTTSDPVYRVYKRRFFGLAQLVLLNIVVSWDVSIYLYPTLHRDCRATA